MTGIFDQLESESVHRINLLRDRVAKLRGVRLSTLGPEGTSSENAGRYLLQQVSPGDHLLELFDTYNQAAERVASGKADLLVVANAFKGIAEYYMSPALSFLCSYFYETPPYGIAAPIGGKIDLRKVQTIASHHAPVSLLPWFLEGSALRYHLVLSDSTAAAALSVQSGAVDLCLTNAVAAQRYGLEFVTRTRPIRMLWSIFQRSKENADALPATQTSAPSEARQGDATR